MCLWLPCPRVISPAWVTALCPGPMGVSVSRKATLTLQGPRCAGRLSLPRRHLGTCGILPTVCEAHRCHGTGTEWSATSARLPTPPLGPRPSPSLPLSLSTCVCLAARQCSVHSQPSPRLRDLAWTTHIQSSCENPCTSLLAVNITCFLPFEL